MLMMNPFGFQGAEETFHRRVVITIAAAAHTTKDLMLCQQGPIIRVHERSVTEKES
jgi:hypothetical protein